MKNNVRWLISAAGFLPFALKLPYIFNAWRFSPMDRRDWVFAVLFLAFAALLRKKLAERRSRPGWGAFALLILSATVYCWGLERGINAVQIASGVWFSFAAVWLAWGGRAAMLALPSFAILLLVCTSSNYWIAYFTGVSGFYVKLLLAAILAGWQLLAVFSRVRSPGGMFFAVGCLAVALLYWFPGADYRMQSPFAPPLDKLSYGDYLGRMMPVTAADRRFFGESEVERKFFVGRENGIHILKVRDFADVHKVHPASHCLRTGGWHIVSEDLRAVALPGGRMLQVSEIVAEYGGMRSLFWAWYSDAEASTGSFLLFRRNYREDGDWRSYQISVPLTDSVDDGRRILVDFLTAAG